MSLQTKSTVGIDFLVLDSQNYRADQVSKIIHYPATLLCNQLIASDAY